eukprot:gene25991-32508_t
MISAGGSAVHVVEFEEEKEYWSFVAGIKRAAHGGYDDEDATGKCLYIESTGVNGKTAKSEDINGKAQYRGVFGMLSSAVQRDTSGSAGAVSGANQTQQRFEISSTTVTVTECGHGGRCVLSLEVASVKAMALTLDFQAAQELVLEVTLETSKTSATPGTVEHPTNTKTSLHAFHLEPLATAQASADPSTAGSSDDNEVCVVCALPAEVYEASPLTLLIPLSESDVLPEARSNAQRASAKNPLEVRDVAVVRSVGVFGEKLGSPPVETQPLPLSLFIQRDSTAGQMGDRMSSDSYKVDAHVSSPEGAASPDGGRLSKTRRSSSSASFYRPFTRSPSNPALNSPTTNTASTAASDVSSHMSSPKKNAPTALTGHDGSTRQSGTVSQFGGSHVSNFVRYNYPVFTEVQVKQRSLSCRAARLFIKLAQDIPTSHPKSRGAPLPPTAYCTAYLMGPNSEKLSANNAEARTEAVKSFCPEWNKEILLQDPRVSMEEVSGVMILIRDAASGVLKHHHIGQVTIPISCFLYQTEADFCLPLEPSYRMREDVQQRSYIGDVHLTTQLVDVEELADHSKQSGTDKTTPASQKSGASSLKIATRSSDFYTAYLRYTLQRASVMTTWWPMRPMMSGAAASGYSYRRMGGHLLCSPDQVLLKLAPGAVGMLYNAKECVDGTLRLAWENVNSAVDLTESVVLLTISFHHCISGPSQMAAKSSELVYAPSVIDVLIGPCPAARLCDWMAQRTAMCDTRRKLSKLAANLHDITRNSIKGGSLAPASPARNRGMSFAFTPHHTTSPARPLRKSSFAQQGDLLGSIRSLAVTLEGLVAEYKDKLNALHALNKLTVSSGMTIRTSQSYKLTAGEYSAPQTRTVSNVAHSLARARLYYTLLRQICRDLAAADPPDSGELPLYTFNAVKFCIETDVQDAQLFTPLRENAKPESLLLRHSHFCDTAVARIRDYVLFASGVWSESGRDCVERLIEGYLGALRQSLLPYTSSKEVFLNLAGGQAFKNCVIRLLVENNYRFHDEVSTLLAASLDMAVTPKLTLSDNVDSVVRWYSASLLAEAKKWLSRTMQQAVENRENKFELPWDVELGDGNNKMSSHLPETVRYQLNIYIELCNTKNVEMRSSKQKTDGPTSDADYSAPDALLLRINSRLVEVVGAVLLALADEYQRALQSKHWEQGDRSSGEVKAYRSFLVAVMNDCHRVTDLHVPETILQVQCIGGAAEEVAHAVKSTFDRISTQTSGHLVRMVFVDVQATLLDFEVMWSDPHNNATRNLASNLTRHLTQLKEGLQQNHFVRIASLCAKVVATRLLIFLRERSTTLSASGSSTGSKNGSSVPSFTPQEITRFVGDVHSLRECFEEALTCESIVLERLRDSGASEDEDDDRHTIAHQVMYLDEVCALLTENRDSARFVQVARGVIQRYAGDHSHVAETLLIHCVSVLRPDATADFVSHLNVIFGSVAAPAQSTGHDERASAVRRMIRDDLYYRVFGVRGDGESEHEQHGDNSESAQRRPSNNAFKNLFVSPKAKGVTTTTPGNGVGSAAGNALKSLNPVAALKHLREKVADSGAVKGVATKRKNEEFAVNLMRVLGLEADQFGSEHLADGASEGPNNLNSAFQDEEMSPADGNESSDSDSDEEGSVAAPLNKRHSATKFALGGLAAMLKSNGGAPGSEVLDEDMCVVVVKALQVKGLHSSSIFGGPNPYL